MLLLFLPKAALAITEQDEANNILLRFTAYPALEDIDLMKF